MEKIYDLVIIGAGPVGIFAATYANMRELDVLLLDSNEQIGGQLSSLYPEKYIYDVAGFDKIKAIDLVHNLQNQLNKYKFDIKLNTTLKTITPGDIKVLNTTMGEIKTRSVIISAGNGAFQPRKIGKKNEIDFTNIRYQMKDLNEYENKKVTILGGGDSALDWALEIANVASVVNIVHRRDDFRAAEHSVTTAQNHPKINFIKPVMLQSLNGDQVCTSITLKNKDTKECFELENDIILVQYGYITDLKALDNLNLEFGEKNKIITNRDMSTNIEGIYAIGDCITYPGRQDLISCGFGEAPIAVVSCAKYLNPNKIIGTVHSSSLFENK